MGGREAWMPHRDVSQGCEPCFSAGFSPLYGKKKGASARVGLAPAAGLVEGALEPSTQCECTIFATTKNSLARL
jgi:hypothetical protein